MLTDYHLHLRPDEAGTPAERYFTTENVDRYLAAARAAGIEELGVSEHVYRFREALEVWDHPFWVEQA
ncbi:MAG: histidinol-phosphatase, partial [Solirubrobacterales bacterium]